MMWTKGFTWLIESFHYARDQKQLWGPEFKIDIERPRDKTALNDNASFKKTRNEIIEYLMEIGNERSSNSEIQYELPDIQPKDLRWEFKASK